MAQNKKIDSGITKTRLSLAYRDLNKMSNKVIQRVGKQVQYLDLSHNEFRNLEFLKNFPELHSLVLDRNVQLECTTLPMMENLRCLWLNNCNIINFPEWLSILQEKCPNLEEFSMMCNPVGNTQLNGVTEAQERKYRKQFIRALPQLRYFDGVAVSKAERRKALKSPMRKVIRKKLGHIKKFSKKLNCVSPKSID